LIIVLVADWMHHMIVECREKGLIKGLGCRDEVIAVTNLHHADDTLSFGKESQPQAIVLKWVLLCFEKWPGLKINYRKSALIF